MLSINTNLSSLITQQSISKATNALNLAIERMTTGFKINHSKDNAAGYSIVNDMSAKISSLDIAEDNVSQGLDLINTADEMLNEINDRIARLRDLQTQASNGTYGKESLKAINAEVNALVDEVQRLYQTAEYNGIKLFMETEADANGKNYYEQESFADESTTFEELEIGASSFGVYSQDGTLIQSYNTIDTDTLGDFLTILRDEGFNANIDNGEITIKSTNDKYIAGDLADKLGISTKETNYVASTEQSFNNQVPVTTESTTIITEMTTTTTSTTNTVTIPVTTTVETTTTRTEQTTTVTSTETVITEWTTTTTSTTSTSTIYTTATVETTTTSTTETIATVYTVTTETLLVPATAAATLAVDDGVAAASETAGFIEPVTRRDTSTMTALSSMASDAELASGTYKISTTAELQQLATITNGGYLSESNTYEFVLADNIDLSSIENWTPIGDGSTYSPRFKGSFDGNGYVISNLTIDNETADYQGLFGCIAYDSNIKNIGIEGGSVKGGQYTGGLVGYSTGIISNSYTTGNVSGNDYVGGLVGYGSDIFNSYASGIVSGNDYVGGLAGHGSSISNSYATSTVTGNSTVGGLIGSSIYSITDCYAIGNISGTTNVGGLVGVSLDDITNSYAIADVSGEKDIGGLVGLGGGSDISIINCTTSGTVIGNSDVGGVLGSKRMESDLTVTSVTVNATVSGTSYVGGVLGSYQVDGGEEFNITDVHILSDSPDLTGVYLGGTDYTGIYLIANDSTYNSCYDTYGIPLYNGVSDSSVTLSNVTPVEVTPPVTYTTATLDTTLGELTGVNDVLFTIYDTAGKQLVISDPSNSLRIVINDLNNIDGYTATLENGVLRITSENEEYVDIDNSGNIFFVIPATESTSLSTKTITTTQTIQVEQVTETPVTQTIWTTTTGETTRTETITSTQTIDVTITDTILTEQVIDTPVTETIWHTTTSETTRTETINTTSTISVTGSTLLSELGPYSSLRVTVISDGTKQFVTLDSDTSLDDFYSDLLALGVNATSSGGITTFTGQGNSYIDSDNIEDILGLSSVTRTMGTKTSNTDSEQLYAKERIYGVYAPGKVSLQAGVDSGANSQIMVDVSFSLRGINNLRGIGENLSSDYLTILDDMLAEITAKQTQFGASANRLESALEDIMIRRDNLISSRSTLRDADIANVSSLYIQQQILQQASATLMATANQSPNIALQLI